MRNKDKIIERNLIENEHIYPYFGKYFCFKGILINFVLL